MHALSQTLWKPGLHLLCGQFTLGICACFLECILSEATDFCILLFFQTQCQKRLLGKTIHIERLFKSLFLLKDRCSCSSRYLDMFFLQVQSISVDRLFPNRTETQSGDWIMGVRGSGWTAAPWRWLAGSLPTELRVFHASGSGFIFEKCATSVMTTLNRWK